MKKKDLYYVKTIIILMKAYEVIEAFENRQIAKSGNYMSSGDKLFLFGNCIAEHKEDGLYITLAGWNTSTTKKALNYLSGVSVSSRQGVINCNGQIIESDQWININPCHTNECTKLNDNSLTERCIC